MCTVKMAIKMERVYEQQQQQQFILITAGFQDNRGKPVPECQTFLDSKTRRGWQW